MLESCVEATKENSFPTCPLPLTGQFRNSGLAYCLAAATPLIEAARDRVRRGAERLAQSYPNVPINADTVEESLASNLVEPLLTMMVRTIVLELNVARLENVLGGDTPEERFGSFLHRLRHPEVVDQLFSEYPVLKDQIVNRLERWAAFSLEFLKHLCEDWRALLSRFGSSSPGSLVMVQGGAGDTHRGGRSVLVAGFASGERLVYKPRSLAADEHFQQLLAWLNERGAQPDFRLLRVLDRGDHGWSEFVSPSPCATPEELLRFYQRQGCYLALLHVLGACDFHCENLIAAGEHPLLIDLEALFHVRSSQASPRNADESAATFLSSSAMGVGLLPVRLWANGQYAGIDISGLGSPAGQLSPEPLPYWEQTGTDEMHLARKRAELPGFSNCPTLNGQRVNPMDYAEHIAFGFASTYRLLLEHRAELLNVLQRFARDEVRLIARPTKSYFTLHQESFHPDVLRRETDRVALFDRLQEAVAYRPELGRLVVAERNDLVRDDIPIFVTRPTSRDLWTSTNDRIENYFEVSGMELVQRRLSQLNEKDLERQLWIVNASMATLAADREEPNSQVQYSPKKTPATSSDQLFSAAAQIGDRLVELAITTDEEANWLGLEVGEQNQYCLWPLGTDLYNGLPGVILFMAYLAAASNESRYSRLAKFALKTLRRKTSQGGLEGGIGAFSGVGGVVYLLSHLGVLWGDSSLFAEAEELASSIPALIEQDQVLDVIGGAAGCALALLALHKCKPSPRTVETARACGEHLLRTAQQMEHGIAWPCGQQTTRFLTGFAHGNAGIAYALFELAAVTNDARFHEAAQRAFEYERSLYSPDRRNWPDLRNTASRTFTTAWCHGAPGIGLSRLCALRVSNDPQLLDEIEAAMATTAASTAGDPTLCHGDLGKADILLYASEALAGPRWRGYAAQAAAIAIESARESGWKCSNPLRVESPGLMTGLAGIGYALLRLATPVRIASVLALEAPVLP